MKIKNHLLINDDIKFVQSPNHSGEYNPGDLDTIIIHYTAGSSASSSIKTLCDPAVKASAHFVIGRDGSVTQLVKLDTIAWHAGASQYNGRIGFNKYSIGIEIDNAGLLEKRGDKYFSWFGKEYSESEVLEAVHRNQQSPKYWQRFTEQQIEKVEQICKLLIPAYNIKQVLGHEEISPGRKIDPGPAFPLDKMRDRLFGTGRDFDGPEEDIEQDMFVNVDGLNIRSGPDVNSTKVAQPLAKGKKVKVIETNGNWVKVKTEITGWVSKGFLKD